MASHWQLSAAAMAVAHADGLLVLARATHGAEECEAFGKIAVPDLVGMLSGAGAEKAALALSILVCGDNGANKDSVCRAGGIVPLVALLRENVSSEATALALRTLQVVADNKATWNAVREAGGIPPLVALLATEFRTGHMAAQLLYGISKDKASHGAFSETGIPPLVALLTAGKDSRPVLHAGRVASVLYNLACNEANRDAIREAGAIAPLVALAVSNEYLAAMYALETLSRLAERNDADCAEAPLNRKAVYKAILDADAVAPLVAQLAAGPDSGCSWPGLRV